MAVTHGNKYALHPNNVALREWCSEQRGRASGLRELMYPEKSRSYLGGFINGEGLFDNDQMELAKPFMQQIESEEKSGKRRVGGAKIKGPSLDTRKRMDRYADVENTVEFQEYSTWFQNYGGHAQLFLDRLGLQLPMRPSGSNLMDEKFRQLLNQAKELVVKLQLPLAPVDIGTNPSLKNPRLGKLHEARIGLHELEFVKAATPLEEFEIMFNEVAKCPKLSRLVPIVMALSYLNLENLDDIVVAYDLYDRFAEKALAGQCSESIAEGWMRGSIRKAVAMINSGWMKEFDQHADSEDLEWLDHHDEFVNVV